MDFEENIPAAERDGVVLPIVERIRQVLAKGNIDYPTFILNSYVYFEIVPVYLQNFMIEKLMDLLKIEMRGRMPNYALDIVFIEKRLRRCKRVYDQFPIVYNVQHRNTINVGGLLKETALENIIIDDKYLLVGLCSTAPKNWDFQNNFADTEIKNGAKNGAHLLETFLKNYGFYYLPKVRTLAKKKQEALNLLIIGNDIPYKVAMFDFLGFNDHLLKQHFLTKNKLFKELASIFHTTDRAIKGNLSVLNPKSKENRERYTAHEHKDLVLTQYQKL